MNTAVSSSTVQTESTGIAPVAARISFWAAAVSLAALAALHVLSPELDPAWRMVSEYALGSYGWVLSLMFAAMSLSCAALLAVILTRVPTLAGKIGLFFLVTACVGLAMASVYDVKQENMHGLAAMIGIPSMPISAMLIGYSLVRSEIWAPSRRAILWAANGVWISLALLIAVVIIGGAKFGPGLLVGIPNRTLMLAYAAWLMIASWRVWHVDGKA